MLLSEWHILELGHTRALRVCGKLLHVLGAEVLASENTTTAVLDAYLFDGKGERARPGVPTSSELAWADIVLIDQSTDARVRAALLDSADPKTVIEITAFGATGPDAGRPATDLTLMCASGIAHMLTGQVDDLAEAPSGAVGEQSAFIGGVAAACSAVLYELGRRRGGAPVTVDLSLHEALATLAIQELAQASLHGKARRRHRVGDGNGSTVCILPARDGFTAISPREEPQWARWLEVMGSPAWGSDPRFATKAGRAEHWDEVHAQMALWSRERGKYEIAEAAQAAHVPSFPLCAPSEHLDSPQMQHRAFFQSALLAGQEFRVPGSPFGISLVGSPGAGAAKDENPPTSPLAGIRVLDFSWVIAGPTTTRYLAALGADVIKVEAPGRGDPGRGSELHTVLGQDKRAITLDLKRSEELETAQRLVASADVVVENFATGVMDRLGLGAHAMHQLNPGLVYVSASGMGRTGPQAKAVAYGTLLQCFSGFAELNMPPERPPRVGMAWLDPMCGLMLALAVGAGLAHGRRTGQGVRVDFSMIEAMLWTMAAPLLAAQTHDPSPRPGFEGVFPASGEDAWVAIGTSSDTQWQALCLEMGNDLEAFTAPSDARTAAGWHEFEQRLGQWTSRHRAEEIERRCRTAGVPCAVLADATDLRSNDHLAAREFWESTPSGVLPGLPWSVGRPRRPGSAPALGEHDGQVAAELENAAD